MVLSSVAALIFSVVRINYDRNVTATWLALYGPHRFLIENFDLELRTDPEESLDLSNKI